MDKFFFPLSFVVAAAGRGGKEKMDEKKEGKGLAKEADPTQGGNMRDKIEINNLISREEIVKRKFSGYVRGNHFSGEWIDGSPMNGYGIYYCEEGEISCFGDFSESGELHDRVECGDLIQQHFEKGDFVVLTVED